MADALVVLNAGSSSLKFSLYALDGTMLALEARGQIEGLTEAPRFIARSADGGIVGQRAWTANTLDHAGATAFLLHFIERDLAQHRVVAVGHRVVHGGVRFDRPVRIGEAVLRELEALIPLAPLHQPHNLAPIRAIANEAPTLPQVACFDTSFHRTQQPLAQTFALPLEFGERGVRRYGFHGLSYEFIASELPSVDAAAARGRVIVAHLGNGASMCAIQAGSSIATTMGFTALDGLVMGTRTGALDPGVVLYLQDELKMDARAIEDLLYRKSGLLGVSGVSSDMRTLLASEAPRAKFAIDLFCYRAVRELGSLAAALQGLDALVFTGGIGENAAPVRAQILRSVQWLGFEVDEIANAASKKRITRSASRVPAYVIATDEELMIARHTRDAVVA
ncbi:MAG TPA: acetate/propionate family kinase [Casimicrobiaceae bacterium]